MAKLLGPREQIIITVDWELANMDFKRCVFWGGTRGGPSLGVSDHVYRGELNSRYSIIYIVARGNRIRG